MERRRERWAADLGVMRPATVGGLSAKGGAPSAPLGADASARFGGLDDHGGQRPGHPADPWRVREAAAQRGARGEQERPALARRVRAIAIALEHLRRQVGEIAAEVEDLSWDGSTQR